MKYLFGLIFFISALVSAQIQYFGTSLSPSKYNLIDLSTGQLVGTPSDTLDACVASSLLLAKKDGPGAVCSYQPVVNFVLQWTKIADENGTTVLAARQIVRYGIGTNWVQQAFSSGQLTCSNDIFGIDPAFGIVKECDLKAGPAIADPDPIPPVVVPPIGPAPMPEMHSGIAVNAAAIPASAAGYSTERVMLSPPGQQAYVPVPSDIGAFRDSCGFSHMLFDDPIVYPGQPGKSHLHTFVGNTGANAASTADSIANSGDSTCGGGIANRTAYWFASLVDTTTGTPIAPLSVNAYYKTGYDGVRNQDIQPFPDGLRFVSGDPMGATPGANAGRWSCDTVTGNTGWRTEIPNDCKSGSGLLMTVGFPQCWDGKNLDSPNHKDHMAFANWQNYVTVEQLAGQPLQWYQTLTPTQGCPPTHPVALPQISYNVWYQVPADRPERIQMDWRLSCDVYDKSLPGGYCIHGDYFLGWKREIMETWVKNCDAASMDCHDFVLGDGRTLY